MRFITHFAALCAVLLAASAWAAPDPATCPPEAKPFTPELFSQAAAQARDRGFLWRISKDQRSSYLYGTMHVGRAAWMAPGPLTKQALRDSDLIGMELDPLDPAVGEAMAAISRQPARALPPVLQARLLARWQAECLKPDALKTGAPEMHAYTLMLAAGQREGLHATYGTEVLLSVLARSMARPVVPLESVTIQLQALLAKDDAEAQAMVRDVLDDMEKGRLRMVLLRTTLAWERADLADLENYAQWCECFNTDMDRVLMKRLLDDRNPALAARIDDMHRSGSRVFAGVGALHMVGPGGLPALMAARGYRVERLR
ncbi:MAG: TraB/GumN family protein [Polaromonas sp.]|uniref:TraB/GumN family protein n=1 Tax=Polaromonas sp. TaxID=1869339 RepID=UPI0017A44300|nr:TraB/GumN family protein [Polaromonas sp.]MBA3592916.1 TraB/GumN family protein [Polaromonas sp.]